MVIMKNSNHIKDLIVVFLLFIGICYTTNERWTLLHLFTSITINFIIVYYGYRISLLFYSDKKTPMYIHILFFAAIIIITLWSMDIYIYYEPSKLNLYIYLVIQSIIINAVAYLRIKN